MRTAVIGTANSNCVGTEKTILQDAGIRGMQRLAGMIPQQMPFDAPTMPPLEDNFGLCSKTIMASLGGFQLAELKHMDTRMPYLLLAWLLAGADNPYRLSQTNAEATIVQHMACLMLATACGASPSAKLFRQATVQADRIAARGWNLKVERLGKMGLALRRLWEILHIIKVADPTAIRRDPAQYWNQRVVTGIEASQEKRNYIKRIAQQWNGMEEAVIWSHVRTVLFTSPDVIE
jgi:hypothetical protein